MIPVILSGGSGSRLWPVSRSSFPKQFCELLDESLYLKTLRRLKPLGEPWTLTVTGLRTLTEHALGEMVLPKTNVIYEPFGRNTAPAIALLCHVLAGRGHAEEVVGIFPADHLIQDEPAFRSAVQSGIVYAEKGEIVTLGVKPTYAATGYGYIETSDEAGPGALRAVGFREKPNESTALEFITRGHFYWNAGMFIFRVSKMAELLKQYAPEIWNEVAKTKADLSNLAEVYEHVKANSIDYAVMERLPAHVCIPCTFDWNDVGSWDALSTIAGQDLESRGTVVKIGADSNFIVPTPGKTYGLVGVKDLIIIDTSDAILIAKKGTSERVKDVVDHLQKNDSSAATQHPFEIRPWGSFEILRDTEEFKSKRIQVNAGQQISYQSHSKRAEHWIIVKGSGEVVLDDDVIPVQKGKHVHIPMGAKHRILNTSELPLEFVKVQLGSYFGEDDIIRYLDDYNRG